MKGSTFVASLPEQSGAGREARILDAVRARDFVPITWVGLTAEHEGRKATFFVAADALSIGEPDDRVRVNVNHTTAQLIADALDAALPTARIVDLAYQHAQVVIPPQIQRWDKRSKNTSRMVLHDAAVEAQRAGRDGLVRNVGKDWVLTNELEGRHDRAANYGWHSRSAPYRAVTPGLRVWQPLATAHDRFHVDYSQVICLVRRDVKVDGVDRDIDEVLTSRELCALLSHEGALRITRHPGVPRATRQTALTRGLAAAEVKADETHASGAFGGRANHDPPRASDATAPTADVRRVASADAQEFASAPPPEFTPAPPVGRWQSTTPDRPSQAVVGADAGSVAVTSRIFGVATL